VSSVIEVAWGFVISHTWNSLIGKVLMICIWLALFSNVSILEWHVIAMTWELFPRVSTVSL